MKFTKEFKEFKKKDTKKQLNDIKEKKESIKNKGEQTPNVQKHKEWLMEMLEKSKPTNPNDG